MAILMSLRAAATEAGSAVWAEASESPPADDPEVGGVPETDQKIMLYFHDKNDHYDVIIRASLITKTLSLQFASVAVNDSDTLDQDTLLANLITFIKSNYFRRTLSFVKSCFCLNLTSHAKI